MAYPFPPNQVNFNLCDHCGKESPSWEPFPKCRECLQDVCPQHEVPGAREDDEGVLMSLCVRCGGTCDHCGKVATLTAVAVCAKGCPPRDPSSWTQLRVCDSCLEPED